MSNMVMDGVQPRSRTTDPTTSQDAGRAVKPAASEDYVLRLLAEYGHMADYQIEDIAIAQAGLREARGLPTFTGQRLRSARADLVKQGRIRAVEGTCAVTPSKRRAHVWGIVGENDA